MKKVLITGASKGLGKEIREFLVQTNDYRIEDWSRSNGYDLTKSIPMFDCDILILNAGVWNNDWKLNFDAPIVMAEQMPKDKLVIFILSTASYQCFNNPAYSAAKAGVLLYARKKQSEGYKFSTISPGAMDCDNFWKNAPMDNRIKGCMKPIVVAELICQIIRSYENGALIKELIVTHT